MKRTFVVWLKDVFEYSSTKLAETLETRSKPISPSLGWIPSSVCVAFVICPRESIAVMSSTFCPGATVTGGEKVAESVDGIDRHAVQRNVRHWSRVRIDVDSPAH